MTTKKNFIKSPLNYTGGKYKLLSQIIPLFPQNIDTFVEPFAGGLNVSLNVQANSYVLNDGCTELIELWNFFKIVDLKSFLYDIDKKISYYDLSLHNVEGYNKLREDRNKSKDNSLLLFLLICYGFNHQIRFNNKGDFNIPFGKERSSYNKVIKKNLIDTIQRIQSYKNLTFTNIDFRKIDFSKLGSNDFVYCDPPYYITTATYNSCWGEKEEIELLETLSNLNKKGTKFALSNVLEHHGQVNEILKNWIEENNIKVIDLNMTYKNSNYHKKEKSSSSREVLVCNY